MNQHLSWWVLLGGAVIVYAIKVVVGGVVGDVLNILILILIALGIVDLLRSLTKKK